MTDTELLARIRERAETAAEGVQLRCEAAFAIASACGCAVREIGRLCDAHGIRIRGCQLGCFP